MQRFILGVLAIALLGAGATVFLVDRYIDKRLANEAAFNRVGSTAMQVLVVKKNIAIGTKLRRSDLVWQAWPEGGIQGEFISSSKADDKKLSRFLGKITRRGIIKGTPLTQNSVFKKDQPGFLAGALEPNMRALSIAVTAQSGAAGFILPGDRVDIILIQDASKKTKSRGKKSGRTNVPKQFLTHIAETILQNVRVLAADQKVDDFEKTAKVSKTVTLEVTQKQAEILALAASMGKLRLSLRSLSDSVNNAADLLARKKAVAEAIRAAKGPTKTTDLEVSPVLAATTGADFNPETAEILSNVDEEDEPIGVKIYRDGQPSQANF